MPATLFAPSAVDTSKFQYPTKPVVGIEDPEETELTVSEVGAAGVVAGVVAELATVGPAPTTLIADTLKKYGVPFVNPVIVADVFVDVPSEKTDHVELSVEYSTR